MTCRQKPTETLYCGSGAGFFSLQGIFLLRCHTVFYGNGAGIGAAANNT